MPRPCSSSGRGGDAAWGETPVVVEVKTPIAVGSYVLDDARQGTPIPAVVFMDGDRRWLGAILPAVAAGQPFSYAMRPQPSNGSTDPGGIRFRPSGPHLDVTIDDRPLTTYRVGPGSKPFFFPVIGPTGDPFTRAYPMVDVPGEDRDHPHQRSCWFTHGNVNGVDFWSEGCDLRLIASLKDVRDIPAKGKSLIIVADLGNRLHFRLFDRDGKVVLDADEKGLPGQSRLVEDLRKQLEGLWPPHALSASEKDRTIPVVSSIVGHSPSELTRTGTIREKDRQVVVEGAVLGRLRTRDDWLAPDGRRVCEDRRTVTFYRTREHRIIDFEIVIEATAGPVTFGDTKEGMFGLRVASSMDATPKKGGKITNAEGLTDDRAWGQASPWVDYVGPVKEQTVGIAILNHPASFRYPTTWHVRTYGLFAANPFGWKDFGKPERGDYTLPAGESIRFAYRVILHKGDTASVGVPALFQAYTGSPTMEVHGD